MKRLFIVTLLVTILTTLVQTNALALEAKMFAITTWTSTCSGGTRSAWDDMCKAWYDEITDCGFSLFGWCLWGHCDECYSRDGSMVNGSISPALFADDTLVSWGLDKYYLDEADAAIICLHGGDSSGKWVGLTRYKSGSNGDCYIKAIDEMTVGDYDLEFLHLSSCHSMDDNMISSAWQYFSRSGSSRILHQVDGFHGCMWIGSSFISDYEDFADDAFSMNIGLAWMENMYRENIKGQYTQCPVAYAVGKNAEDCFDRLFNERYDNVYSDPTSIGYYCYYYYPNCDPDCESAFGSDTSN